MWIGGYLRAVFASGRRRGIAGLAGAVLLAIGLPGAAAAQSAPEGSPPAAEPGVAIPVDEFDRGTPRRAVHGFLVACREGDYARAANYLSLASLEPNERESDGPALARELKTVLDRKLWIELDRLSDEPSGHADDGAPARRDRIGAIETGSGPVEILVDRVPRGDGVMIWKFASQTVRDIPRLYDEFGYGKLGAWLPPVFFESHFLEVQLWQWLGLTAAILAAFVASWFVARGIVALLRPLVTRSSTEVDDLFLAAAMVPLRSLIAALFVYAALPLLSLSVPAQHFFENAAQVGAMIAGTWLVLRLIDVLADVIDATLVERGDQGATALVPLGRKAIKVLIIGLAILASLDSFGFDVTALLAGLGVGGLAVALAAQKTIENLFGGATLIADRPVQVGDFCRFGDKVGTVEEIGMRSTRIRTLDRTVVTVPNSEFASLHLENFGKRDRMRYNPSLGLLYATTPDQLRYVLVELRRMLYSHPRVLKDPARVRFVGFGSSSLDVEIFAYVDATDYSEYLGIAEDLNLRIMDIVAESGTGFAFPSNTTYLAKDEGTDPERTRRAEARVREWIERGELYLPGFPEDRIAAVSESIEYPGPGVPKGVVK